MPEKPISLRLMAVDDEQAVVDDIKNYISNTDHLEFHGFCSPQKALDWANLNTFDIAVVDYHMPNMNGLELINTLAKKYKESYYLLMTGHADLQIAIDAIRTGIFDFIVKPFNQKEFQLAVERVQKHVNLKRQNKYLRDLLHSSYGKEQLIGQSEEIISIHDKIKLYAQSEAPVLITGETGVGKEIVAKMIHAESNRNQHCFSPVNCSAFAQTLLESELFGHEKGAFTGADRQRIGRFELAKNGTILLDEIAEIPPQLQVKLLRVLQEKEYERVGGNTTIKLCARVISITNRDIEKAIKNKMLREDLFYRLNTLHIHVPPLRERGKDSLLLANHFLSRFSLIYNKKAPSFSERAKDLICNYSWPGNVRQLENAVECAVLSCEMGTIYEEHLPKEILKISEQPKYVDNETSEFIMEDRSIPNLISDIERKKIIACLEKNNWNKSRASSSLGISRGQLLYRLKKYGITNKEVKSKV
jgi:DNA-binding NtrC family response regulator